jgi:hypothetical protein
MTKEGRNEILEFCGFVEVLAKKNDVSKNLHETATLVRLFSLSICQIVRGAIASLDSNSVLAAKITLRSMIEYIADLSLIAVRNCHDFNSNFANYHYLLLSWSTDDFDSHREKIPQIKKLEDEAIYRSYLKEISQNKLGDGIITSEKVAKLVKKKFKKHWSGMNFQERISALFVEGLFTDVSDNSIGVYESCAGELNSSKGQEWSEAGPERRTEMMIEALSKKYHRKADWCADPILHTLTYLSRIFKFSSNFTHPTPYSCVPHLFAMDGTFQLEYSYSDDELDFAAQNILFSLVSTAYILAFWSGEARYHQMINSFWKEIVHKKYLKETIEKSTGPIDATRFSD